MKRSLNWYTSLLCIGRSTFSNVAIFDENKYFKFYKKKILEILLKNIKYMLRPMQSKLVYQFKNLYIF